MVEEFFKKLQETGRNTTDTLLHWINESKIIDNTKEAQDRARKLFEDVTDKQNVELAKFNEVVGSLADQQKRNVDELTQKLVDGVPRFQEALTNAAQAFKDTMNKP